MAGAYFCHGDVGMATEDWRADGSSGCCGGGIAEDGQDARIGQGIVELHGAGGVVRRGHVEVWIGEVGLQITHLQQFAQGERGTLRIGMECHPCYQWLLKIVSPYLAEWPDVEVDVKQPAQYALFPLWRMKKYQS